MAEAIFRYRVAEAGLQDAFEIDSAGTGDWHIGQLPDPRTLDVLRENGITEVTRARQVRTQDFQDFDLILAMDHSNVRNLAAWRGADPDRVRLMLEFDPVRESEEVPDPYYDGPEAFREVYAMLDRACANLLEDLRERL